MLRTGDRIRIDLNGNRVDMLVDDEEIARCRAALEETPYDGPASQTPWQESIATSPGSSTVAR